MSPGHPPCPYERHTRPHKRKRLHRHLSTDTVLAVRAFLLLELHRNRSLLAEYDRRILSTPLDPDDVMGKFIVKAKDGFAHAVTYLTAVLHNLDGMNWLDTDLKAAFAAADQYVPPPVRRSLEQPEAP